MPGPPKLWEGDFKHSVDLQLLEGWDSFFGMQGHKRVMRAGLGLRSRRKKTGHRGQSFVAFPDQLAQQLDPMLESRIGFGSSLQAISGKVNPPVKGNQGPQRDDR
jgi:hypothetical protein